MLLLISWSVLLATLGYAGLAAWRFLIARTHPGAHHLGFAFLGMALWTGSILVAPGQVVVLAELLRDVGWLAFFVATVRAREQDAGVRRTVISFCTLLGLLVVLRTGLLLSLLMSALDDQMLHVLGVGSVVVRWVFAVTGVFFAHFVYRATAPVAGSGFRVIVVALGAMWAYNLNLFTLMLLGYPQAALMLDLRAVVALVMLVPFAIGARRKERWRMTLSRQATTQSLLFVAIGGYFVVIASATRAALWAGQSAGSILRILLAAALTAAVAALALMPRLRATLKASFITHLFEHRYDYRVEWLRFSATIGDRGTSELSPEQRAIRAVADVMESPGGALLLAEAGGRLVLSTTWQFDVPRLAVPLPPISPEWHDHLVETARVLDLDAIRTADAPVAADGEVPEWLLREQALWIAVPLVRSQRLVGLIALARPLAARELDWEDFDLLKVIALQVAVHLTDAQSQAELEEARRFEEFNRRFAFIIHDLKNVVSQLSLVSSNAEEHGANPKFQASMVKTLGNATAKMSTLLAKLSTARAPTEPVITEFDPVAVLRRLAEENRAANPIELVTEGRCRIRADAERLQEALGHLLTNAIEASPPGAAVQLSLGVADGRAVIGVEDQGRGMSASFVRTELFKPFASTKPNGFGIGAAEARALIAGMGGALEVVSVEGEGTRFSAIFPALPATQDDELTKVHA